MENNGYFTATFSIAIAKEFGTDEAILLNNLVYWCTKNKANNKHFHDGRYWTYNTSAAFAALFPYLSEHRIERMIKKLIEKGLIYVGNYNQNTYDRTRWFSINEKAINEIDKCILRNREMEVAKPQNGFSETAETIPNTNTDTITNVKTNSSGYKKFVPPTVEEVIEFFVEKGYTKESAIKAHEYYEVGNWHDKNGKAVKNWKQKMSSVWFRDEHKAKPDPKDEIEKYRGMRGFREIQHVSAHYWFRIETDEQGEKIKYYPHGYRP
jgi:hypothetical protein